MRGEGPQQLLKIHKGQVRCLNVFEQKIYSMAHLPLSYGQFMSLFSKTVAERTKPGQRQDVEEKCTAP